MFNHSVKVVAMGDLGMAVSDPPAVGHVLKTYVVSKLSSHFCLYNLSFNFDTQPFLNYLIRLLDQDCAGVGIAVGGGEADGGAFYCTYKY